MATQIEVAKHLDLSDKQIRNLLTKGVLPVSKGRGGYDLDACRVAYIKYLRGVKTGQIKDTDEQETAERKADLFKEKKELVKLRKENYQLSILMKEYAPIFIITETLQRVSASLAIKFESLTARLLSVWPDMPPEAKELIEKEMAEGSEELANVQPDISDYLESDSDSDEDWLNAIED